MGNKVLEFIIRAKDTTAAGLNSARSAFSGMAGKVGAGIKGLMGSMAAMAGVTVSVGAAIKLFTSSIEAAFKFEKYQSSFKVLLGSLDAAKAHMADLRDLAQNGTFNFEQLGDASSKLLVLTKNVLGGKESLRMLADVAQATGASLPALAQDLGNAFAALTAGGDMGRALIQLEHAGAISKETGQKLREMGENGASLSDMWKLLEGDMMRFKGAVDEASKTGIEMMDDLKDAWNDALAEFGAAFMDVSKNGIGALTDKLTELRENGDIAVWADKVKLALDTVKESIATVASGLAAVYKWSGAKDIVAGMKGGWAAAGTLAGGGSLKDAARASAKEAAGGTYQGMLNNLIGDPFGIGAENAKEAEAQKAREATIRATAKERLAQSAAGTPENKKIADALAAAEVEKAKKSAEAKQAAWDKMDKKMADAEQKAMEKSEGEQFESLFDLKEKHDKELLKQQKDGLQKQIEANDAAIEQQAGGPAAAEARMQKANAAVNQAWGWVNDPKAFKAQLKSEKEQAKAEARFEKDAERVKSMQDWRTRKLSDKDEAVRRMVLAKENQQKAEDQLQQIQRHVAHLEMIRKDLQKALNAAGG